MLINGKLWGVSSLEKRASPRFRDDSRCSNLALNPKNNLLDVKNSHLRLKTALLKPFI